MALFKAAIVILLTLTPMLLDAYPVAQSAENKGRGRSYPVIISQYSNVRNSKYNEPERTTTEAAKPNVVELVKEEAQPPTNQVIDLDVAANPTEEKKSETIPADVAQVAVQTEETKIEADATPVDDTKKVETVEPVNQDASSQTGSEAAKVITDSKNESSPAAIPSVDSTAAVADVAAVEISKDITQVQEEKIEESTAVKAESTSDVQQVESQPPIKEQQDIPSATSLAVAGNDESQSSAADKPALTAAAVAVAVALEESLPQKETAAADADSVAQQAKQPEQDVSPVESPKVQPENNNSNDGQTAQTAAATDAAAAAPTELMAAPVAEATVGQESGRTSDLQPTKTGGELLFEEDRSFKDRPEDSILAALQRQGTMDSAVLAEKLAAAKTLDGLVVDDMTNEGIRLERDDKKSEDKKKEKEKLLVKMKEKKTGVSSSKPVLATSSSSSDDPVQEYEEPIRGARAEDGAPVSDVSEQKPIENGEAEADPVVISLVPSNYPVILPSGESTLSDKIQSQDTKPIENGEAESDPVVISLVPSNYPVVLPSGESTLSDKVKAEEPIVIGMVPDQHPVVLPNGESALSNKPTGSESQKEEKSAPSN